MKLVYNNYMYSIKIEKIEEEAVDQLREISIVTFSESFGDQNTADDMKAYVEKEFSREHLLAELRHPESTFYAAFMNEQMIGYLKLNKGSAQTEGEDKRTIEIQRIYVLQNFQGHKVGQHLYEKALHIAIQEGMQSIWLGVWEKNIRAIHFYERNGFKPFSTHVFWLGDDKQTDILMRLSLIA